MFVIKCPLTDPQYTKITLFYNLILKLVLLEKYKTTIIFYLQYIVLFLNHKQINKTTNSYL